MGNTTMAFDNFTMRNIWLTCELTEEERCFVSSNSSEMHGSQILWGGSIHRLSPYFELLKILHKTNRKIQLRCNDEANPRLSCESRTCMFSWLFHLSLMCPFGCSIHLPHPYSEEHYCATNSDLRKSPPNIDLLYNASSHTLILVCRSQSSNMSSQMKNSQFLIYYYQIICTNKTDWTSNVGTAANYSMINRRYISLTGIPTYTFFSTILLHNFTAQFCSQSCNWYWYISCTKV